MTSTIPYFCISLHRVNIKWSNGMGISGLGPLLVKEGLLSDQDRMIIGKSSGSQSWAFAKGVIASGLLDEDELASFLAERTRFQVAPKNFLGAASPEALAVLDINLITMLEVFPLNLTKQSITVAMVDPLDKSVLRQLEFFSGLRVRPVIASLSSIHAGLQKLNPQFTPPQSDLEKFFFNHAPSAFQQQRLREPQNTVSSAASLLPKEDVIKPFCPPVVQKTKSHTQAIASPSLDFSGSDDFKDLPPIDGDHEPNLDELADSDDIAIDAGGAEGMTEFLSEQSEATAEAMTDDELTPSTEPETQDPNNILDNDDEFFANEPIVDETGIETAETSVDFDFSVEEQDAISEPSIESPAMEPALVMEEEELAATQEEPAVTEEVLELDETLVDDGSPLELELDNTEVLNELAELTNDETELTFPTNSSPEEALGDLSPAAMNDVNSTQNDPVFEESFADDAAILDVAAANQNAIQDSVIDEEEGMAAFVGGVDSLRVEDDQIEEDFELTVSTPTEDSILLEDESETTSLANKTRPSIDDEVDSLLSDQDREYLDDHNDRDKDEPGARVYMHPAMGDLNQSLLYLSMATAESKAMDVAARGLMPILSRGVFYKVRERKITPELAWEGHEIKSDLNAYQTQNLPQLLSSITADQWQIVELKEQGFMFWQDDEHKMVATSFGDFNEGLLVIGHFKQSCFRVEGFQQTTLNLCRLLWGRMEQGLEEGGRMVVD